MLDMFHGADLPGFMIFAKVAGSHSHNTNIDTSDLDGLGIYVAPTEGVLGYKNVEETWCNCSNDFTAHEVGKFCSLLIKGNPNIIEMLYTDRMCYTTQWWMYLREHRDSFLSRNVIGQYLGYLNAQIRKLEKGTSVHTTGGRYNKKFAYHLLRLGMEAKQIADGIGPTVWYEGEDRKFLLDVREEKYSQAQVEQMAKKMVREIEDKKPWNLPDIGDEKYLTKWLIDVRMNDMP
jgi:hypothetical protein